MRRRGGEGGERREREEKGGRGRKEREREEKGDRKGGTRKGLLDI